MLDQKTKEKVLKGTSELRLLAAQLRTGLYRAKRSVPARPTAAEVAAQTSWEPSGPGDFRKAGGEPMDAEEKGLVSCYRSDMAKFEKLPVGEEKLEIGKNLNVAMARLSARGITIGKWSFAAHNIEQLTLEIQSIEREIKALNADRENQSRNPLHYGVWTRETELQALVERWSRMLAAKETWQRWGEAASAGRQIADSPETIAMRERAEKIAEEIRQINDREERGLSTGAERKRRSELQLAHGRLDSKLRGA
jgi:hypothetical protein